MQPTEGLLIMFCTGNKKALHLSGMKCRAASLLKNAKLFNNGANLAFYFYTAKHATEIINFHWQCQHRHE